MSSMKKVPNVPGVYYRLDKAGKKIYYLRLKQGKTQTWRRVGPRLKDAKNLWYAIKLGKTEDDLGVVLPKKIAFKQLSAEYYKDYQLRTIAKRDSGVKSVIKRLDRFFGKIQISQITPWTIANYVRKRKKFDNPAKSTINLELEYLRAILNKAVEWRLLSSAPKIVTFPIPERRARVLSPEEIEIAIREASLDHRDAIMIALDQGLRIDEIFSLTPEQVDFDRKELTVRSKSLKSRTIPMTTRVAQILERRFKKYKGRVFATSSSANLSGKFSRERKRLDLKPWRFHDLRHCFITNLLRKGVDPYTVMKLSGHTKLEMVTRYLHTSEDLKRAAIDKLEEMPAVTKTDSISQARKP